MLLTSEIAGLVFAGIVVVIAVAFVGYLCWARRRRGIEEREARRAGLDQANLGVR